MEAELGFYPLKFEDTDSGCRCTYVVKNRSDTTLDSFRANVKVYNEQGHFDCDIGVAGDKVEAGEIQELSNLMVGAKCGAVTQVELFYINRCQLTGRSLDCQYDNYELMSYNGVTWKE